MLFSEFRVGKMRFHHCCLPPGRNHSDAHASPTSTNAPSSRAHKQGRKPKMYSPSRTQVQRSFAQLAVFENYSSQIISQNWSNHLKSTYQFKSKHFQILMDVILCKLKRGSKKKQERKTKYVTSLE